MNQACQTGIGTAFAIAHMNRQQFALDRRHDDIRVSPTGDQASKALTQSDLGFSPEVLDRLR